MHFFRAIIEGLSRLFETDRCEDAMDDETFYRTYYGNTDIPREIPIRVRRVFVEQLGSRWGRVEPGDRPAEEEGELDFAELIYEIEDEFGIKVGDEDMQRLVGVDDSFDGIVQYLARNQSRLSKPIGSE